MFDAICGQTVTLKQIEGAGTTLLQRKGNITVFGYF